MEVEIYRKQQHKSIMANADWQVCVHQSGNRLCKNNTIVRSFNKRVVQHTYPQTGHDGQKQQQPTSTEQLF